MTDERQERSAAMSVCGAAFPGIGAMIGAGIFALLGGAGDWIWQRVRDPGAGVPAAPAATASGP